MTSGNFALHPMSEIWVDREKRQRRTLVNLEELADSIRQVGLINPITIRRNGELIAGERRFEAHKLLGFHEITVQFIEDLSTDEAYFIELEENLRRSDLTWQDHVNAVAAYHNMRKEQAEEWTLDQTADALNVSPTTVSRNMLVKSALDEGVPEVVDAPKFSTAANFAERRKERQRASAMRELSLDSPTPSQPAELAGEILSPDEPIPAPSRFIEIEQANFLDWSNHVQEIPFNLIHCDFPYGVNAGDKIGQSSAKSYGGYADSKDIYFELLDAFCNRIDRFCDPSAHLIFWFSMDYYNETKEALSAAGWAVNIFPLIWHKPDNSGILPDPNRGPRRTYETAFFAARGDRKIVKAVQNSIACPTPSKDDRIHMSEKPRPMLEHFFRMVVDDTTRILDPTCGSGNALGVAEGLGAQHALGLELNPDFIEAAKLKLEL